MEKQQKFNDFGLGNKSTNEGFRILNKDGTFNIKKTNIPFFERFNFFHTLVTMKWSHFFGFILIGYIFVNLIFATIYSLIGIEHLTDVRGETAFEQFTEAFFFSAQTITTLGYGRVAPIGLAANIIAAIESLLGLLFFALATGLMYGRFSKPQSKIRYSEKAVIAPYKAINGFMFRVVNPQDNQLLDVEIEVNLSVKREDSLLRDFYSLELERKTVRFFPAIWTVVHPISKSSPLHNMTEADYTTKDIEFITALKAVDESSGQTLYSRSSYKANDIFWGKKFAYVANQNNGITYVDVSRINETLETELN